MAHIFLKEAEKNGGGAGKSGPTLDYACRFADESFGGGLQVTLSLSSDAASFTSTLLASKLSQRRAWPLYNIFGYAGLSTSRFPGDADAEKAICLDMLSFKQLFESPQQLVEKLREKAAALVEEWNGLFGGSKAAGKRRPLEKSFVVQEVAFPWGNGVVKSQILLTISSFYITRELLHSQEASVTPGDLKVTIKMRTNLPSKWDTRGGEGYSGELYMTKFGVYLPMQTFEKLALSREMKDTVREAKRHLEARGKSVDMSRARKGIKIVTETETSGNRNAETKESEAEAPPPKKKTKKRDE